MPTIVPVVRHQDLLESRPLKTGESFALVVAEPLFNALTFDKTEYAIGDTAELRIAGAHLKAPLEVVVETNDGAGWVYADTVKAEPAADGKSASVQWRVPDPSAPRSTTAPASAPEPGTGVDDLQFEDGADLSGCDVAWMRARLHGLDGEQVQFFLDREDEAGNFVEIGEATALVRDNEARAGVPLGA